MEFHPDYCYDCQRADPPLAMGGVKSSWGPAAYKCRAFCGYKVCGTKHPLLNRGEVVALGSPGKCGDCDYQDYLNSPGGM